MSNPVSEPRTEHQDPWKGVEMFQVAPCGGVYLADEVDAARAAVVARHAEEIAALELAEGVATKRLTEVADERDQAEAELTTLREQLAAVQRVAKEWNEFAFTGEDDYVPVGDGCIAARCADQVEAIIAGKDPGDSLMVYTHDDIDERRKRRAALSSPSTQEPQTVCEWREDEKGIWRTRCNSVELSSDELHNGPGIHWNDCPYCGKPLTLSPESPNEGAK